MMKPGSVWGWCKFRHVGPVSFGRGQRTGWAYICDKDGRICNPDYCLGPDEDKNSKGEMHEQETE